MTPLSVAGSVALAVLSSAALAAPGGDPLAAYVAKARVLAVVARDASDPRFAEQRRIYNAMKTGARERDLVLVEGVGRSARADALRRRFAIGPDQFRAVLIGKDGTDKLSSETPLGADALFPLIDAMPMRQEEMRRRP